MINKLKSIFLKPLKISICTQIKNRLYQFRKTFNKNINILKNKKNVEWIIVDCESSDGLDEYLSGYINRYNFIKYYRTINFNYSIPIAKNFAARLSTGNYIFNLDCDNFLDNIIDEILATDQGVNCNEYLTGSHGRIGMHREIFKQVSGYDENFYPAAVHENDIMLRCGHLGYSFKNIPSVSKAIPNSKIDTVKYFGDMTWKKMRELNEIIMKDNEIKKIIKVNNNFTPCSFTFNLKQHVEKNNEF